jgi:predicted outer membrane repeat protein
MIIHEGDVTGILTSVKQSNFTDGRISGGGDAFGGGIFFFIGGASSHVKTVLERCMFTSSLLVAGPSHGFAEGGGAYVLYGGDVEDVQTSILETVFRNNTLHATADGAAASGGGVFLMHTGQAHAVTTTVSGCVFTAQLLLAHGDAPKHEGQALAGALMLIHKGAASGVSVVIKLSRFEANVCYAGGINGFAHGGAIYLDYIHANMDTNNSLVGCTFVRNAAVGQDGKGGAIFHRAHRSTASVALSRCTFEANHATGPYGGAVFAQQDASNPPANLQMEVQGPFPSSHLFPYECTLKRLTGKTEAREWSYSNSTLRIEWSDFRHNSVGGAFDGLKVNLPPLPPLANSKAFGGAVYVTNLQTQIHSSNVSLNRAGSSGGGIFLGPGSASLLLSGDTNISGNTAHDSGSAVYSASGGDIRVGDATAIQFATAMASGLTVLSGGNLQYGNASALSCGEEGEQLEYNVSSFPAQFDNWRIDCSDIRSVRNGEDVVFAHETCKQIQYPNKTALHTFPCGGLPLEPAMLMTTGTIGCSSCSGGRYSLDRGRKTGNAPPHVITCHPCPYGANCNGGGSALRVNAGFWGYQYSEITSRSNANISSIPTPAALLLACPHGYCCNDNQGCEWGSASTCSGNRDPAIPLCGGCSPGYSQAIDGTGCMNDAQCGNLHGYLAFQMGSWLLYVLYSLCLAKNETLLKLLPRCLGTKLAGRNRTPPNGAFSCIMFFYQLAIVVAPKAASSLHLVVATVFNTNTGEGQGSVCLEGLTMEYQLIWQMFESLAPIALLFLIKALVVSIFSLTSRARAKCASGGDDMEMEEHANHEEHLNPMPSTSGDDGSSALATPVAWLLLFAFSSFSQATLKLLNCVPVAGRTVLFYSGATECGLWQLPLYLVLVFLALVPAVICLVWVCCQCDSEWANAARWPRTHTLTALRESALQPFVPEHWHWAALLALQRVVTVMCATLPTEAAEKSTCVVLVSLWFLCFQVGFSTFAPLSSHRPDY